jgi:hypothetical protein
MKKTLWALALVAGVSLVAAGCAKPPTDAVNAAKAALETARTSGAADYAAESLTAAETAVTAMDAELKAQADAFALTRSYTKAAELASAAKAAADKAVADASAGREAAKAEATTLIAGVRTGVDEVKKMLETAPKGKGTKADIEAMKSDVAAVEAGLPDLDAAFSAGKYKEAKAKAEAAQKTLDGIKSDIEAAIAARAAGRR